MHKGTRLFLITLVIGLVLTVLGYLLAAPLGAPSGPNTADPRMPFAPLVFVIGVILIFSSAIVYEVVRDDE